MMKRKLKIAFGSFFILSAAGIAGGVAYLESERFAETVKKIISERSPENFGIIGDFSNLKLHFFPPGIGLANPKIKINRNNLTKLTIEGQVEAKEMRIRFAPIQMLSGTLQLSEVAIIGGLVQGKIGEDVFQTKKKPSAKTKLSWKDLFEVQIQSVLFEDTDMNIEADSGKADDHFKSEFVVKHLSISKKQKNDQASFQSVGLVHAVKLVVPKKLINIPISEATQLQWNMELSDQGLKLDPFTADFSGSSLSLSGRVTGNLLDGNQSLEMKADATLVSDLGTLFQVNFKDNDWDGRAKLTGSFQASLNDFQHTFRGSYALEAKEIQWKDLKASLLEGSGQIDLSKNKIEIKRLTVSDDTNPSNPGKIRVKDATIPLGLSEGFKAELELQDARMHWLGGVVLDSVYPLEGSFSGKINAQFIPQEKKRWSLFLNHSLWVKNFALTNQSYGKSRAKHYILKPAIPLHLEGGTLISPEGVEFKNLQVSLQKSIFNVTGGVFAKTGFNFKAIGPVYLNELKEIAESPVHGEGKIQATIHGPASHVVLDFDVDLKNAAYLDLLLGNVVGRISYDDGTSQILFSKINAKQNQTIYSLDQGHINLDDSDLVHLPFEIQTGRVDDLALILTPLVKNISWYPKALRGEVHGKILLGGQLSTALLQVSSSLGGSDWEWMGERARRVQMNFGYNRGIYSVQNVSILKTKGEVHGFVNFNSNNDEIQWETGSSNLTFSDIDLLGRLEIPARSKIEISSTGSGRLNKIRSKAEVRLHGTEIKGQILDPTLIELEVGESNLYAKFNIFGKSLQSQIKYSLLSRQPSYFKLELNHFDFSPALLILNPKLLDDPDLRGVINGKIHLDFLSEQFELARGMIEIDEYSIQKSGFNLILIDPIKMPIQLGYFNLRPTRIRFKNGELTLKGEGKKGDLDLHLTGKSDLAFVELLSSSVLKINGVADNDIHFFGPLKNMKINGDVTFTNVNAQMRWLQSAFEELDGTIHIRQNTLFLEGFEAYLGDELFSLSGKIYTFTDRFPEMDLSAHFEDNKVKMEPFSYIQVKGIATLKGTEPPYTIGGNLEVIQAMWTKSFSQNGPLEGSGQRFAPVDDRSGVTNDLLKLDMNVNASHRFYVKNELIDAEFKGKVKLIGPPENPKLLGDAQLVQGKVLFRDRPFVFETVRLDFDSPYELNPKLNATAVSEINQYKIRVLAYGRTKSWKAEFSSSPFLQENEIYSLLASGYTTTTTSRYRNRDKSYVNQGEAASLILHSLDFSKDVQSRTGLQFDVEEAIDQQSANSIFRPQNLGDVASPKVVLKRPLGSKATLSFGTTVGVGSQNQREIGAEYRLSNRFSILGIWNNTEEENIQDTYTSYGLDLKFNKKFK